MKESQIKKRHELISPFLDEKILRLYVAAEASSYGFGGVSKIARITGISRPTIIAGNKELLNGVEKFADEIAMTVTVCHFPPGTSKWNKIEHRLFSYISQNWRGKPLVSHEIIVNLIASMSTRAGLQVKCRLDTNKYPKGIKVSDKELDAVKISRHEFHGEWNYTIEPKSQAKV